MKRVLAIALLCFWVTQFAFSQGYKIDVDFEASDNEAIYMGYYLNGNTYVMDTANTADGKYLFEGDEPLEKGMYFLAKATTLLFDFVIGEDQIFELRAKQNAPSLTKVIGDLDNELFFENMRFNQQMSEEAAPFIETVQDSASNEEAQQQAREAILAMNQKASDYQGEVITKHPSSVLATLFRSGKQVEFPAELAEVSDVDGQMKKLYYYRNHYWDHFDLGNPMLLRLPRSVFKEKVDDYLDNLTNPLPDSIKAAADFLIGQAKKNETTYQTLVWHLTTKYQTSNIMGMDKIYVHLVDTYFLTGEMDFWANDQLKKNLKEKADQHRNSLIGMTAPNLVLQDLAAQPKALHDLSNDYTVIYFYDPDCGHCKKETPVLKDFYETTSFDVGVYTVSADSSMAKTMDYIAESGHQEWMNTNGTKTFGINYLDVYDAFTTPTIFLLNKEKVIIAKKIKASQLDDAIQQYERIKNQN